MESSLADTPTASLSTGALSAERVLSHVTSLRPGRLLRQADLILLLLVPFVLLITTPSWSYLPPYGYIDPYIYTGFFQHLHQFLNEFSQTYYASRLPWLLVGNA